MKKWSNGASKRLVETHTDQDAADMRTIIDAMSKLPPSQLKKISDAGCH